MTGPDIVTVTTQYQLNALPSVFKKQTIINIRTNELYIHINRTFKNAIIRLLDVELGAIINTKTPVIVNGFVKILVDGESVVFVEKAQKVFAAGNSQIYAQVVGDEVTAAGSATVHAYRNTEVKAADRSNIILYSEATCEATENARISAFDSSTITIKSKNVNILKLYDQASIIMDNISGDISVKDFRPAIDSASNSKKTFISNLRNKFPEQSDDEGIYLFYGIYSSTYSDYASFVFNIQNSNNKRHFPCKLHPFLLLAHDSLETLLPMVVYVKYENIKQTDNISRIYVDKMQPQFLLTFDEMAKPYSEILKYKLNKQRS